MPIPLFCELLEGKNHILLNSISIGPGTYEVRGERLIEFVELGKFAFNSKVSLK